MRGHLQCRDTLAGNEGCPLKTGTTVVLITGLRNHNFECYELLYMMRYMPT